MYQLTDSKDKFIAFLDTIEDMLEFINNTINDNNENDVTENVKDANHGKDNLFERLTGIELYNHVLFSEYNKNIMYITESDYSGRKETVTTYKSGENTKEIIVNEDMHAIIIFNASESRSYTYEEGSKIGYYTDLIKKTVDMKVSRDLLIRQLENF